MSTLFHKLQHHRRFCLSLLVLSLIACTGCGDPPQANSSQKVALQLERYDEYFSVEDTNNIPPHNLTATLYSTYYKKKRHKTKKSSYILYVQKTDQEKVQFSQSEYKDTTLEIRILAPSIGSLPRELTLRLPHTLREEQSSIAELIYYDNNGRAAVLASLPFEAIESSFFGLISNGPYDLTAEITNSAIYYATNEEPTFFDNVLEFYDINDYFANTDLSSSTALAVITVKLERTEQ